MAFTATRQKQAEENLFKRGVEVKKAGAVSPVVGHRLGRAVNLQGVDNDCQLKQLPRHRIATHTHANTHTKKETNERYAISLRRPRVIITFLRVQVSRSNKNLFFFFPSHHGVNEKEKQVAGTWGGGLLQGLVEGPQSYNVKRGDY